ncbi:MAG: IclR family transcriptional regulator [Rhodobacteraceae bacterium]|nr:IclR family transcriptional regulator [Paracoccaceae bacterium]
MDGQNGETRIGSIPTNLRMLLVLEEIAQSGVPVTPTEVNQRIGLPKPTIHRLFATLEAEGFIMRELDGKSYTPGKRLRRLSINVLSSLRVRTARLAVLGRLAEEVGETCNIAVPDRDAMFYLDRVETKWPLRIQLPIGTHVPFYCTASGKMYLSSLNEAHLERYLRAGHFVQHTASTLTSIDALRNEISLTRDRGYSEDAEEFMDGMIAIACPILDDQDRLLSTVSFHAPAVRLTLEVARSHVERLRAAAAELSRLLLI